MMTICDKEADTDKETSSEYDINYEEKTSSTSENKEKARDGYFFMYECGKHLLHSMYECACVAQEKAISMLLFTTHKTV